MREIKIDLARAQAIIGGANDHCVNQRELDILVDELQDLVDEGVGR